VLINFCPYQHDFSSSLQFTDKDSGTYKLVIKNNGGEITSTATVNVDGEF
jgi:hypothetical protein